MLTSYGDGRGAPPRNHVTGKARTGILLWLLGVPLPLILLYFLIKGCAA
jgi:hypothetical protein